MRARKRYYQPKKKVNALTRVAYILNISIKDTFGNEISINYPEGLNKAEIEKMLGLHMKVSSISGRKSICKFLINYKKLNSMSEYLIKCLNLQDQVDHILAMQGSFQKIVCYS